MHEFPVPKQWLYKIRVGLPVYLLVVLITVRVVLFTDRSAVNSPTDTITNMVRDMSHYCVGIDLLSMCLNK